jgi:biotin operon repressor
MSASSLTVTDLAHLLKVIADESRLRILGTLSEQPMTGKDLAARLDLTPATISHHMRKLVESGIVTAEADAQRQWYRLNADLLRASRSTPMGQQVDTPTPETGTMAEEDQYRARVLRNFFDGDRLKNIPAQRKQRVVVLQHLVERFDPARSYPEREVNDILRSVHDDVATLRRELVDYGFLQRDRGIYQVTRGTPNRGATVAQEIIGDERVWLRNLISDVVGTTKT